MSSNGLESLKGIKMFVYLVTWDQDAGKCADVFDSKESARLFADKMHAESQITCLVQLKAVRTISYVHMVYGE